MDIQTQLARFIADHARELHWLVKDAHGVWSQEDMQGEIYLALVELADDEGRMPYLGTAEDDESVLRRLRRKAEQQGRAFRNASRLDHAPTDQAPLIERLVADGGHHPASLLESSGEAPEERFEVPPPEHSSMAAWHHLVERFDRRMRHVAEYLLISPSWCYCCRRRVRKQAIAQWPLPQPERPTTPDALRPWRSFKLPPRARPEARQLRLDYWTCPSQPSRGQLWLL